MKINILNWFKPDSPLEVARKDLKAHQRELVRARQVCHLSRARQVYHETSIADLHKSVLELEKETL